MSEMDYGIAWWEVMGCNPLVGSMSRDINFERGCITSTERTGVPDIYIVLLLLRHTLKDSSYESIFCK
jgi:hypothetical protein